MDLFELKIKKSNGHELIKLPFIPRTGEYITLLNCKTYKVIEVTYKIGESLTEVYCEEV